MQHVRWTAVAMALSASCWIGAAAAQEQIRTPNAAPPAPPAAAPPGFEPAPVPSHPPAPLADTARPATNTGPLAPGGMRLRLNGQLTGTVGTYSDSGRSGH